MSLGLQGISCAYGRRKGQMCGASSLCCAFMRCGMWAYEVQVVFFVDEFTGRNCPSLNLDTIVAGIQFGLIGCLSIVSTFTVELNAIRENGHPWRTYGYATITNNSQVHVGRLSLTQPASLMV
ncbi:hypothetical protein RJT34_20214 [Clitoria ternatea]|uniref:Uncharacterized protein n=1 Tax=Clitoria ternatea TaxID=43366 RepID=A0AAN9P5J6_CLITE